MASAVWSKAGTHCVWCGKREATQAEWDREHEEHDQDKPEDKCWCMAFCWDCDASETTLLQLRGEHETLRDLLHEVAKSGVEFDGIRKYVTVQIDRSTWDALRSLPAGDEPKEGA